MENITSTTTTTGETRPHARPEDSELVELLNKLRAGDTSTLERQSYAYLCTNRDAIAESILDSRANDQHAMYWLGRTIEQSNFFRLYFLLGMRIGWNEWLPLFNYFLAISDGINVCQKIISKAKSNSIWMPLVHGLLKNFDRRVRLLMIYAVENEIVKAAWIPNEEIQGVLRTTVSGIEIHIPTERAAQSALEKLEILLQADAKSYPVGVGGRGAAAGISASQSLSTPLLAYQQSGQQEPQFGRVILYYKGRVAPLKPIAIVSLNLLPLFGAFSGAYADTVIPILSGIALLVSLYFMSIAHVAVEFQYDRQRRNGYDNYRRSVVINLCPAGRAGKLDLLLSPCCPRTTTEQDKANANRRPVLVPLATPECCLARMYHRTLQYFFYYNGRIVIDNVNFIRIKAKLDQLSRVDASFDNARYYIPGRITGRPKLVRAASDPHDVLRVRRLQIGWALCKVTRAGQVNHSCTTVVNELLDEVGIKERVNYKSLYLNTYLRWLLFLIMFTAIFTVTDLVIDKALDGEYFNDFYPVGIRIGPIFILMFLTFGYLDGLGIENCCYSSCGRTSSCYRPATLFREMLYVDQRGCCHPCLECTDGPYQADPVLNFYYMTPLDGRVRVRDSMVSGQQTARDFSFHICSAEP